MDLTTDYLGLKLKHPFIVGASPLVYNLDTVRKLEDAGASGIVMHSLFEEQIEQQEGGPDGEGDPRVPYPQAREFYLNPDKYLEHLRKIKEICGCPVIGSLNGVTEGGWIEYAKYIEEAGADALEINLYFVPRSADESAAVMEQRTFQIVRMLRQTVTIPVAVKISPFFTSVMHFAHRMEEAGAQGLVLFNRFLQPDIDIEQLEMVPKLRLSDGNELLRRLRWLAVLHGRLRLNLACTGGVVTPEGGIKALMAGADVVQLVTVLMKKGPGHMKAFVDEVEKWMDAHEYESINEVRGTMSYEHSPRPDVVSRAQYMRVLQSWAERQE